MTIWTDLLGLEFEVRHVDAKGIKTRALIAGEFLGGRTAAFLIKSTTAAVMEDDIDLTHKRLQLLMHDQKDSTKELVETLYVIYHQPEFQKKLHNLLCLQNMEICQRNMMREEQLSQIKAPRLVIWGRNNPFGEVPEANKMQEVIRGTRLELFDEYDHWPQHEHPELYNPLAIAFLKEHISQ